MSSASDEAQREALQADLAYLDVLPRDGEGSVGDTDAALNSLFAAEDLQQFAVSVGEGEDGDGDKQGQGEGEGQDLEIDPVLTIAEAAAQADAQLRAEDEAMAEAGVEDTSAAAAAAVGVEPEAEPESTEPPPKRRATSRINMLARGAACDYCKRRKLKCSAEHPSCAVCKRQDRPCVYLQKPQKSRVKVLEDRLAELEKKLGSSAAEGGETAPASPQPHVQAQAGPSGSTHTPSSYPGTIYALDPATGSTGSTFISPLAPPPEGDEGDPEGFTYSDGLDIGFNLDMLTGKDEEPDLMTLADAATHDRIEAGGKYPWVGMGAEQIAREILAAVGGSKGVGEKIVLFLLQAYISPRNPQTSLAILDPSTILSRLNPRSSSPLHPALILSIIILVLPLLPSSALPPSAPSAIATALLSPARTYSAQAYSTGDARLLDVVAAQAIRAIAFFQEGRFLDGWAETSGSAALAWACGLGKLGGVGQRFLDPEERGEGWEERCKREEKLREWRYKGVVVQPPKDRKEYAERVRLFWAIYMLDRGAAVGWGWPSSFNDDEITTPFPLESYDTSESLRNMSTLKDFLSSDVQSGQDDSVFCTQLKAFTLLYKATRLFDNDSATPEETRKLLSISEQYSSSMSPVSRQGSGEWGIKQGPVNANWMTLHAAMLLMYGKEAVDASCAEDTSAEVHALQSCIAASGKVVDCVELAREMGDFAFEGYDLTCATVWSIVGRSAHKLEMRLRVDHALREIMGMGSMEESRGGGIQLSEALRVMGKRIPYAATCAQILENISLGVEGKVGEWVRPDWTRP